MGIDMSRWSGKSDMTKDVGANVLTGLLVGGLMATPAAGGLPGLPPAAESRWQAYVTAAEAHRARGVADASRFLVLDQRGDAAERRAVLGGDVVIRPVELPQRDGMSSVPGAHVHHWRGAVFVPGTPVDRLVASLEQRPPTQADVLSARIVARGPSGMHVYMRLRRQQMVTVVYDTEHLVRFTRHGAGRASSTSRAVRITEVRDAGTPGERHLSDAEDRDFLWRLHAYWRYQDVPGGVIAECESISLSRDVPFGLRIVTRPLITRTAESSMRAALLALRG
jgi:hypothetical protein